MPGTTQFMIGADARSNDGAVGTVTRVVIDPVARAVTHLVVEPKHRQGLGRLVPLALVDDAADPAADAKGAKDGTIRLNCSTAAFEQLDIAEETAFLPGTGDHGDYGPGDVLSWPYYGLSMGGGMGLGLGNITPPVIYDTVPLGEVSVRRGDQVHALDGNVGQVQGLAIDPRSHHVTHILLQEGHLWGRRDVAIPISAVAKVTSGIELKISKKEIEELPQVAVDEHPDLGDPHPDRR